MPPGVELDLDDLLPKPKVLFILDPKDFLGLELEELDELEEEGLRDDDDLPHEELDDEEGLDKLDDEREDEREEPKDWVG